MDSLVSPQNTWTLWALIISGTGFSIWLEQQYKWAAKISGPVLAMLMAMVLSNLMIMPNESPAYAFVGDYLVPLAIPLLLFRANIFHIIRTTGGMFVAFHLSALGSLIGAVVATLLLRDHVEEVAHIAGIMTGSYTGGAVNFFAVKESFDISENLTNPLLVADNFIMAGMFIVLLFIAGSRFFLERYPHPHTQESSTTAAKTLAAEHWRRKEISLLDIAKALAVAFTIVAVAMEASALIKAHVREGMVQAILSNTYVLTTFISVLVATLFHRPMGRIHGSEEIGGYMLYVFLFAIGLPADLRSVIQNVPVLFLFCLIMAVFNLAITLGVGRLLKINLEELLLCVNATLGGPPTAAAMAVAKGWSKLVLPSLLVGIWGYVIGTVLGVTLGNILLNM